MRAGLSGTQALQQLEEALEVSRREALDASKLRAELAAAAARADAAIKDKERAEELLAKARAASDCFADSTWYAFTLPFGSRARRSVQAESEKKEAIAAAAKATQAIHAGAAKKELLSPAPTLPAPRTAAADGRGPPRASDNDDSPAAAPAPAPAKDSADADALLPAVQTTAAIAPAAFARKKPRPKSNFSMLIAAGTFALLPPSQSAMPAPSQQMSKAALPLVASVQRGAKTKVC